MTPDTRDPGQEGPSEEREPHYEFLCGFEARAKKAEAALAAAQEQIANLNMTLKAETDGHDAARKEAEIMRGEAIAYRQDADAANEALAEARVITVYYEKGCNQALALLKAEQERSAGLARELEAAKEELEIQRMQNESEKLIIASEALAAEAKECKHLHLTSDKPDPGMVALRADRDHQESLAQDAFSETLAMDKRRREAVDERDAALAELKKNHRQFHHELYDDAKKAGKWDLACDSCQDSDARYNAALAAIAEKDRELLTWANDIAEYIPHEDEDGLIKKTRDRLLRILALTTDGSALARLKAEVAREARMEGAEQALNDFANDFGHTPEDCRGCDFCTAARFARKKAAELREGGK